MKKILSMMLAVLMIVGAVSMLASCSQKDNDDEQAKKQDIIVGYTIYQPMNFKNDKGELVGFDTDLAKAVFEDLGYNVIFKEIKWDQKYTELEAGTISCIWNGFTSNGEDDGKARSEYVDFSYNYMINKQVVVMKTDDAASVSSAADLSGKVGSAEKGSVGYGYLGNTFKDAMVKDAESQLSALQDLKMGGCDFVVLDEQLAKAYAGKGDYADYTIVEALSSDIEYYAIGFKKGSDLTAKVNATLEKFAKNGKLNEIATAYSLQNAVVTDYADQK